MTDRELRLIATVRCIPYKCDALVYVQDKHPSGHRHLVVQYGDGYCGRNDLPTAATAALSLRPAFPTT